MLGDKLDHHQADVWLINTGWTGGAFGHGQRMPIKATRAMLSAALLGALDGIACRTDEIFGFSVPTEVPGVDPNLLDPRSTWSDADAYDRKARELARMFVENFEKRFADADGAVRAAGPKLTAVK